MNAGELSVLRIDRRRYGPPYTSGAFQRCNLRQLYAQVWLVPSGDWQELSELPHC